MQPFIAIARDAACTASEHMADLVKEFPDVHPLTLMAHAIFRAQTDRELADGTTPERAVEIVASSIAADVELNGLDEVLADFAEMIKEESGVDLDLSAFTVEELAELAEHHIMLLADEPDAEPDYLWRTAFEATKLGRDPAAEPEVAVTEAGEAAAEGVGGIEDSPSVADGVITIPLALLKAGARVVIELHPASDFSEAA